MTATAAQSPVKGSIGELLRDGYDSLGWRLIALFAIMPLVGVFEGFGMSLLVPLLARLGMGAPDPNNPLAVAIQGALDALHIPKDFTSLLLFTVAVMQLQVAATLARGWIESDSQARYLETWQRRLFAAFVAADWTHTMRERSAAQVNAIVTEAGRISAALNLVVQIAACSVFAFIYAVISLAGAWQIVALLAIVGAMIHFATRPLTGRGARIGENLGLAAEQLQHATHEFLHNAKLVKATATEDVAARGFASVVAELRITGIKASFHPKIMLAIYMSCGFLLLGAGVWIALGALALEPAAIIVSIYMFLRLYVQLANLQSFRQSLAVTMPALPVALGMLARARAAAEPRAGGALLPDSGPCAIEIRDLDVRYDGNVALRGVTCGVPAGAIVGITGPSGAGKSTLADAVVGLIRPSAGVVLIDGRPVHSLDPLAWRRSIGYVTQDTLLLRDTIANNIAWGHEGVGLTAIAAAARLAHADDFIREFPEGYDTVIGDRGVRLSGGQRQRLGLARALLGRKRLLILDETTSALDSESEAKVLEAVDSLRGRVTVLMVAHRLSTLKIADQILVFEHGCLSEAGDFGALVHRGGQFARLWRLQSEAGGLSPSAAAQ